MAKKVLVSGIQATGQLHFGNYFGAMRQTIELANSGEYDAYIFIADYHALTTVKDKDALLTSTLEIASAYVACGLDITKATLFRQSRVPEHAELSLIFTNVVTMPYLMRAHAFKAHVQKNREGETIQADNSYETDVSSSNDKVDARINSLSEIVTGINTGLFNYPVLMASDILMYQADLVPVGHDQKQHIEYARDIAGFYNRAWGVEQFRLPQEHIIDSVAIVPGIDGLKMSKSKGNVIPLFGSDDEVRKAVMGIVTDSASPADKKNPDTNTIYAIHKLFLNEEEDRLLRSKFEEGGYGYKQAKDDLLVSIMKWREGKVAIFNDFMSNPEKIKTILEQGGVKAQQVAQMTMRNVREQIGL